MEQERAAREARERELLEKEKEMRRMAEEKARLLQVRLVLLCSIRSKKKLVLPWQEKEKREAEARGLDKIFKSAGFEWGEPGCAMCFYAGGETFAPGARVVSSTNRNFEGRQGPGVRTHITSPVVVAASAVAGKICTPANLPVLEMEAN